SLVAEARRQLIQINPGRWQAGPCGGLRIQSRPSDMSTMDTAAASSIRRDETVPIALLLAFAGGYIDAYTWIIHGVMANAQTANLVLLWVYGSAGKWEQALRFVPPILAFAVGIVMAASLRNATGERASAISTLVEILLLIT